MGMSRQLAEHEGGTQRRFQSIPREDVLRHCTQESLWIIIHDMVIDCTQWQHEHPGGAHVLLGVGGRDATLQFSVIHSKQAKSRMKDFVLGRVAREDSDSEVEEPSMSKWRFS